MNKEENKNTNNNKVWVIVFYVILTILCFPLAAIIGLVHWGITLQNKQVKKMQAIGEEKLNAILIENNFKITKSIEVPVCKNSMEVNAHQIIKFLVDNENKKFAIFNYDRIFDKLEFKAVKYSDLINFNLFEDGEQKIQGKGMIAASGALLFGVAGAVVGSVAGDQKIKNKCSELSIRIQINDLQNPLLSFILVSNTDKNSFYYKRSKQVADDIIATLTYIENNK